MKKMIILLLAFILLAGPYIGQNPQAYGDSAVDYFNLGMQSSLDYKKIEYFTKALELNPRFAPAYEKRGLFYFFQGKYDKVIEDLTRFIRLAPDKADVYRLLAVAYLKVNNYSKAITNFDRAIELEPEMSAAYCYRAEALRLSGKPMEAIQDATTSIELKGDERTMADAYKTRGRAYQEIGRDDLAEADFNKSIEFDPRLVIYRYFASSASLEAMRNAGFVGIIAIAFVFLFGFKLKPPRKDE